MAGLLPTEPGVSTVRTQHCIHMHQLSRLTGKQMDTHRHTSRECQKFLQIIYICFMISSDFNGLACDHGCSNISFTTVPTTTYSAATSTVAVDYATSVPAKCGCRARFSDKFSDCK